MYKQIIALALFVAVAHSQTVGFRDCGSTATITSVRAGDCLQTPCPFQRGQTYNIQFTGVSTAVASDLPFQIVGNILGLETVILEGNACQGQVACPTTVGQTINFSYQYTVSTAFPPVPVTTISRVRNQAGAFVLCIEVDIQIT